MRNDVRVQEFHTLFSSELHTITEAIEIAPTMRL
jgi:hypothetical protein